MGGYDRAKLKAELEEAEACRLKWYWDSAQPRRRTIGIGRNLDDVGIRPAEQRALGITVASCIAKGITRPIALALCDSDIAACEADLDRALPWWRGMTDARQRVLLNMCFNMGLATLLGFKNTLAAMQAGRYADAAAGMLASHWADQVGNRAVRLAAMMAKG
jgi:lysozyme